MTRHYSVSSSDGLRLHVVEHGNPAAPPILFIHGYLFSSAVFVRQIEGPLAATHRLISLDLRGHGGSDKPADPSAYQHAKVWADDVASVIDALKLDRALIVGWSLGSRVALNYAWTYGFGRIAGLNLVGASLGTDNHKAGLPPHLRDLLSPDAEVRRALTAKFVDACAVPGYVERNLLDAFTATAMDVPLEARVGARGWPIPYDDNLSWISGPVLISHGIDDPLVPEAKARAQVDAIPGAALALIENAGHLAFLQQSDRFNDDLARFAARAFQP